MLWSRGEQERSHHSFWLSAPAWIHPTTVIHDNASTEQAIPSFDVREVCWSQHHEADPEILTLIMGQEGQRNILMVKAKENYFKMAKPFFNKTKVWSRDDIILLRWKELFIGLVLQDPEQHVTFLQSMWCPRFWKSTFSNCESFRMSHH